MDVALSFQDPEGCNNIWDFIQEVQRHLQLIYGICRASQIVGTDNANQFTP